MTSASRKALTAEPTTKVKASVRTKLIARYHRLVDLRFAGKLTPSMEAELEGLNRTFDSWESKEIAAMERHFDRKSAEVDRLLADIQRERAELLNASNRQKSKAGSA